MKPILTRFFLLSVLLMGTAHAGTRTLDGLEIGTTNDQVVSTFPLANVAALRALTTTALPVADLITVASYYAAANAAPDGLGFDAVYVPSDTTSSDNGISIFVDASNRRWYRATGSGTPVTPTIYNIKQYPGCQNAASGGDDTSCLAGFFTYINSTANTVAYFPCGKYRMNGTLYSTSAILFKGDSMGCSYLVETNPTADLLVIETPTVAVPNSVAWPVNQMVRDITLAGLGTGTSGNLLVVVASPFQADHVGFMGHAGTAMLLAAERGHYRNIYFSHVRRAIAPASGAAMNESFLQDFQVMDAGNACNDLYSDATSCFSYNVNAVAGVIPSTGALIQDQHAGIDLGENTVNFTIQRGSIKPTTDLAGIHIGASQNATVGQVYFEGFQNNSINPALIYGGYHQQATTSSAITSGSQLVFDVTDGSWFQSVASNSTVLGLLGIGVPYIIRPPDYSCGSTTPSSIGGGIQQGYFEIVSYAGIIHDGVGSGWHVNLSARAQGTNTECGGNGGTAYNWPAGAIIQEAWSTQSDALHVENNHFESINPAYVGHVTLTCNPNIGQSCAEIVVGLMPDTFFSAGSATQGLSINGSTFSSSSREAAFSGNNRAFQGGFAGYLETHNLAKLDFTAQPWPYGNDNTNTSAIGAAASAWQTPLQGGGITNAAYSGGNASLVYKDSLSWQFFSGTGNGAGALTNYFQTLPGPSGNIANASRTTYNNAFTFADTVASGQSTYLCSFLGSSTSIPGMACQNWTGAAYNTYFQVTPTVATVPHDIAMPKGSATGTAPGAGFLKFEVVAGTTGGSCKIIAYAGTSTTPVTVVDNVGSGC